MLTFPTGEKSVRDQMSTLLEKWHPDSPNCTFSYYFYNNVPPEHVPYYGPAMGEDERKWEEALINKPSEGCIPVLARGFAAIGQRLQIQVSAVHALQSRLHEINNSLTAMMQNHDLVISVRTADARRKHAALSQRCLGVAAKVQVLRNRGYALDATEEELKKKLKEIEKGAFDPVLNGRQEEIWARMSGVRARARFLQEEFEKTGRALQQQDEEEILDEENMKTVKKVCLPPAREYHHPLQY
jgi:nuclear pore complex protein Nup54